MNNQHQRIFAVFLKVGRIEKDAVFRETIRPEPLELFSFAEGQRGDLVIEIGKTSWRVVGRAHVIELGRLGRGDPSKSDLALAADKNIHPEGPRGADIAQREFFRSASERLEPQ